MDSLGELLTPYAETVERYLELWLVEPGVPDSLAEAMRYSVLGAGKRLRPALVLMAAEAAAGTDEPNELTARAAVAIELVHCYSLVHDDLPAMDNDDLRRGRPSAHVQFGETMAILAGDSLLTRAFGVLGDAAGENSAQSELAALLVGELALASGPAGMVAGQVADLKLCDVPAGDEGLRYIHLHKTAAMIRATVRMGALCAGAGKDKLEAITEYGQSLGLAFQLVDDLLDITGTSEVLGKTPGKDQLDEKRTGVAELGVDRAHELAGDLTARAIAALAPLGPDGQKLQTLAEMLTERVH